MFGRDKGFGVPVVAATTDAEGIEKRAELFVGESSSAEEEERTEKREGGCADMTGGRRDCVSPIRMERYHYKCDLLALLLLPNEFPSRLSRSTTRRVPSSRLQLLPPRQDFRCGHQNSRLMGCNLQVSSRCPHPGSAYPQSFFSNALFTYLLRGLLPPSLHRRVCRIGG